MICKYCETSLDARDIAAHTAEICRVILRNRFDSQAAHILAIERVTDDFRTKLTKAEEETAQLRATYDRMREASAANE